MSQGKQEPTERDFAAEIAGQRAKLRDDLLIEPQPPDLPDTVLPCETSDPAAAFRPRPRLDTLGKLQRELERERRAHARFLRDLAPPPERTRIVVPIEDCDWRQQTEADLADFTSILQGAGQWTQVHIPHYAGPLGRATTYYRATFTITPEMLVKGALFACFKAVDYQAHVFVNGAYLGSHKGIFAPFEFDFTHVARQGENVLFIRVENDAICMGNDWGPDADKYEGDKICAAEGPGWDEPEVGWHITPPGMGILQDVTVEARAPLHVHAIFVRPLLEEARAEAWVEVYSCHLLRQDIRLQLSVYGQNFRGTVCKDRPYAPLGQAGPTINYYRLSFDVPQPRAWSTDTPWLYQAQVRVLNAQGQTLDVATRQFGMRSFRMDEDSDPKGRLYLNGQEVRLQGANVSGSIQQCVSRKDWDQLRDDILLAKICHMNFFRIIQRPVQPEVYDCCDRLGVMTQTDLPLFGVLRRNQYCEAVRQVEEMERLVRSHPCNILVSFINEPFPNAMDKPQRHLTRRELESFFRAASEAVRLANPDRVIKPVDGDYDPPAPGLPDNHCYCGWYNGHGLDLGKLHKGYWQQVKPGWLYGCGEFGAEGLDTVELMRKYCPPTWLPQTAEEERKWLPDRIPTAQTGRFHYLWFDTQDSLEDWVTASRAHQAWVLRLMVEAFRRDSRMNSFAVYYLIDSWPTGWMKAIVDYDRQPKPAFYACREALTPLMVTLRGDRYAFFAGQEMPFEAWICNAAHQVFENAYLHYQLEVKGEIVFAQRSKAAIPACGSAFQGHLRMLAPLVSTRTRATLRLGLLGESGAPLHDNAVELDILPRPVEMPQRRAHVVGAPEGKAARLAVELGLDRAAPSAITPDDVILVDDFEAFDREQSTILQAVRQGVTAVFLELPAGDYEIAGDEVQVMPCGMGARHFVSRATGHPLVAGLVATDFRFWYDPAHGYVTPLLATTFRAPGWKPILTSGNGDWSGEWTPAPAAAEKRVGTGVLRICQVALAGRIEGHPAALLFARRLLGLERDPT